jgi:uncharacterized protein with PIN domain
LVECPQCKGSNVSKVKEWEVKPKKKTGPALHVTLYQCNGCGKKFRAAEKLSS